MLSMPKHPSACSHLRFATVGRQGDNSCHAELAEALPKGEIIINNPPAFPAIAPGPWPVVHHWERYHATRECLP
jgi:hypothetical protein